MPYFWANVYRTLRLHEIRAIIGPIITFRGALRFEPCLRARASPAWFNGAGTCT